MDSKSIFEKLCNEFAFQLHEAGKCGHLKSHKIVIPGFYETMRTKYQEIYHMKIIKSIGPITTVLGDEVEHIGAYEEYLNTNDLLRINKSHIMS
jgi:hypothetical protein